MHPKFMIGLTRRVIKRCVDIFITLDASNEPGQLVMLPIKEGFVNIPNYLLQHGNDMTTWNGDKGSGKPLPPNTISTLLVRMR